MKTLLGEEAFNMQLKLVLKSLQLQKRRQHEAQIKMFLPPGAKRKVLTLWSQIIVPLVIKVPRPDISNSSNSTAGNNSTAT